MHEFSQTNSQRTYYRFEDVDVPFPEHVLEQAVTPPANLAKIVGPELLPVSKPGFWRRQFSPTVTSGQTKFDAIFGVALPLICFYFDPIVFRSFETHGTGILSMVKTPAYLLAFAAIMATLACLFWGPQLKWANSLLAGFLGVASIGALGIGVVLFPLSAVCAIFLVGLLGFTPLFTSFVLLRNSVRSFRSAKPLLERNLLANCCGLAAMTTAALTYLIYLWTR